MILLPPRDLCGFSRHAELGGGGVKGALCRLPAAGARSLGSPPPAHVTLVVICGSYGSVGVSLQGLMSVAPNPKVATQRKVTRVF